MRNRKATTADFLIAGFLFLLVLAVVVPFIIAVFKIKAHIRRSGTSRNNQR